MAKTDIIESGELMHKIEIQKRTIVKDNFGQEIETFSKFLEVWANVSRKIQSTGFQTDSGRKKKVRNQYYVEIRYISVLREDMQIIFRGKTLKILNIENVFETDNKLLIICEEVI